MLNRYNFASSSFEFSTFLSSRFARKIACSPHFHLLHLSGVILQDYNWLRKWRRGWLYVRSNTKNAKSLLITTHHISFLQIRVSVITDSTSKFCVFTVESPDVTLSELSPVSFLVHQNGENAKSKWTLFRWNDTENYCCASIFQTEHHSSVFLSLILMF